MVMWPLKVMPATRADCSAIAACVHIASFTRSTRSDGPKYKRSAKTVENAVRRLTGLWNKLQRMGYATANPWLNLFRRLPLRIGPLDLSPIVAIIVLQLVGSIIIGAVRG